MNFISIDFETANENYNSACSMGIVVVENGSIAKEEYHLIKPPSLQFRERNMSIHGIRPNDVLNKPTFPELWNNISQYFNNENFIVAHNATFDMSVLKATLEDYEIETPNFNYFCSMAMSNRAVKRMKLPTKDYRTLDKLSSLFEIELEHHNALSDSRACAQLVLKTLETVNRKSINSFISTYGPRFKVYSFEELELKSRSVSFSKFSSKRINVSEITTENESFNKDHPFYEKTLVFTGDMKCIDRKSAMQKVVDVGGIVKSGVSKKIDYLVVGIQDKSLVGDDGLSSKEKKAIKYINEGLYIKMISEDDFLKLL